MGELCLKEWHCRMPYIDARLWLQGVSGKVAPPSCLGNWFDGRALLENMALTDAIYRCKAVVAGRFREGGTSIMPWELVRWESFAWERGIDGHAALRTQGDWFDGRAVFGNSALTDVPQTGSRICERQSLASRSRPAHEGAVLLTI